MASKFISIGFFTMNVGGIVFSLAYLTDFEIFYQITHNFFPPVGLQNSNYKLFLEQMFQSSAYKELNNSSKDFFIK